MPFGSWWKGEPACNGVLLVKELGSDPMKEEE